MITNIVSLDKQKEKLNILIDTTKTQLNEIKDNILIAQISYNDYIDRTKTMRFFEVYKWEACKIKYNTIKNDVTSAKKHYRKIAKKYSNIICSYNNNEINSINKDIMIIKNVTDEILYIFSILRQTHIYTRTQIKYIKQYPQIVFVKNNDNQEVNQKVNQIIIKLYESYNKIKNAKKDLYDKHKEKISLLHEINVLENKLK